VFDHCGDRTSHRADQAPKPVRGGLLPDLGENLLKTFKQTFFAPRLDNLGFIEAQYEVLGNGAQDTSVPSGTIENARLLV
jgi:hypothetical protein